jgi:hypothetical protein
MRTMCTDCGSAPKHPDAPCGYCRDCSEKNGHRYPFYVCIDQDKLRALLGGEVSERVIAECKSRHGCGD